MINMNVNLRIEYHKDQQIECWLLFGNITCIGKCFLAVTLGVEYFTVQKGAYCTSHLAWLGPFLG